MTPFWRNFDRVLNAMAFVAAAIIPFMFITIVYDVTARSLRMFQINWAVAVTEYGLLYVTALGAPWLLRDKGHVSMEAFRVLMPPHVARLIEKGVIIACAAACALVAVVAVPVMIQNFGVTDIRANFLTRWLLFAPIVLAFGLCSVQFVRVLVTGGSLYKGISADQEGL